MNVKYSEALKLLAKEGPDALVDAVVAENDRIRRSWRAGFLSYDQAEAALAFPDPLFALMGSRHWSFSPGNDLQVEWMRPDRYERMVAEMGAWRGGGRPESAAGQPWLFRWHPSPYLGAYRTGYDEPIGEASAEDKALLFRMMGATFTPASAFETYPADMALPNARYETLGGKWVITIRSPVADDGGLTTDERPVGACFDLAFAEGGCAHLRVLSMEPLSRADIYGDDDGRPVGGWFRYRARGWVEGYTEPGCGKLAVVDVVDWEISEITLSGPASGAQGVDPDLVTHEAHPLWEPFRRWDGEHEARVLADRRDLVQEFLGPDR